MTASGRRRCALALAGALALAACGGDDAPGPAVAPGPPLFQPPEPPVPLVRVSGATPFAAGCDGEQAGGTLYPSSEVEPWVSVNPLAPDNLVGTWQQDRWSSGGAQGLLAGVSFDGGQTWGIRQAPFSRCTGGNSVNGGDYARATDPWVSFGGDGIAYWMAMTISDLAGQGVSAMRVSRSLDGGDTWEMPVTLIHDTSPFFNDKNAITADPVDAGYAYAVWDRLDFAQNKGPAFFSRTTDGGDTWEAARAIHDPGANAQTVGNQVVVLPDGTVVNLFTEIHYGTPVTPASATLRIVRSADKGASWGVPLTVGEVLAVGVSDPETGTPLRTGGILGSIAVSPAGELWVAWQDARHSGGARDGIVLSQSADGGLTWSEPALVSDPAAAAFTPSLAVAADGSLGLTGYDLRDNTPDPQTLLTGYWLATSADGGATWAERRVSGPFDHAIAPNALGLFLGDYQSLAASGASFVPFFVQTFPDLANRTNVYAVALPLMPVVARSLRRALPPEPQAVTVEWAWRTGQHIRQSLRHFPDRPGLPAYLR